MSDKPSRRKANCRNDLFGVRPRRYLSCQELVLMIGAIWNWRSNQRLNFAVAIKQAKLTGAETELFPQIKRKQRDDHSANGHIRDRRYQFFRETSLLVWKKWSLPGAGSAQQIR